MGFDETLWAPVAAFLRTTDFVHQTNVTIRPHRPGMQKTKARSKGPGSSKDIRKAEFLTVGEACYSAINCDVLKTFKREPWVALDREPVWPSGKALNAGKQKDLGSIRFGSPFSSKNCGSWTLSRDFLSTQLMKH